MCNTHCSLQMGSNDVLSFFLVWNYLFLETINSGTEHCGFFSSEISISNIILHLRKLFPNFIYYFFFLCWQHSPSDPVHKHLHKHSANRNTNGKWVLKNSAIETVFLKCGASLPHPGRACQGEQAPLPRKAKRNHKLLPNHSKMFSSFQQPWKDKLPQALGIQTISLKIFTGC